MQAVEDGEDSAFQLLRGLAVLVGDTLGLSAMAFVSQVREQHT